MKRRKRHKKSSRAPRSGRGLNAKATQAVLAYDIARYSAETIYYRVATLQKAAAGSFEPEIFAMVAEKMLAVGAAMAIATRQIGPMQQLWTGAWFEQLSTLQQAWHREKISYDVGRTFADVAKYWLKADDLLDAATLSQMRPVHRAVKGNARRLENLRVH